MSAKEFSSVKIKVIAAFSLLALGLMTAIYFSVNSFNQISASVEILAQPDQKSMHLNQLLTDVSEAESQIRAYSLTHEKQYLRNYEKQLSQVFGKLDTLRTLTAYQPRQRKRIDSIGLLMQEKIAGLNEFMELKVMTDNQTFSAKALRRLNDSTKEPVKINKALKTTEKKTEENLPTIPKVSIEPVEKKGFITRLFSNKNRKVIKMEESDEKMLTTTRTEVSIDTIVISQPAADTIMKNVRQILKEVQQEEKVNRRQLTSQELGMLQKDQAIMDQIRKMIKELDREEAVASVLNARKARNVANRSSVIIFMISCAGLLMSLVFMVLIVKDITRSNYYKKSLEIARQRSENLRQIKEQFLANMSHEIRTPLNAIIGFSEQLRKSPLPPQQKEQVKAISSSSDFLLAIVTDILDLSKIEAGQLRFEKKDFELRSLIEETCYVTQSKAQGKDIKLVKDFPEGDFFLLGDPFRLQQILYNLLSNAFKFTEEGEVKIHFTAKDNGFGKYVVNIQVQDTGIGINADQLPYIFENFSQADESITRKYGGTGLGLSITKKLVDLQGGQIIVNSEKGKGSCFSISIPYQAGDEKMALENAREEEETPDARWKGKKVLLVDDDAINALLLKTVLRKWGIKTEEAANGFDALEKMKSHQFELVLSDINMPGMSGLELVKEIRLLQEEKARVPVVAVTANAMRKDLKSYMQKGMDAYLVKPYTEKDLIRLLASVWNGDDAGEDAGSLAEIPEAEKEVKEKQAIIAERAGAVTFEEDPEQEEPYNLGIFNKFAAGDSQAFLLLLQSFLENTAENRALLHSLHQQEDYANLSELAHKMYPTFKHLEANEVAKRLKELEFYDAAGSCGAELNEMIQKLEEGINEVVIFVEEEVNKITHSETV